MDAVIQIAGCMTGKLKMRKKKCESVKVNTVVNRGE